MLLEPTFWAEHGSRSANYGIGVSLQVPAADLDAVTEAMVAVGGDDALVNATGSEDLGKVEPVGDAIDLESNAVLVSAGVVLVFGLVLLGSASGPGRRRGRRGPGDPGGPRPDRPSAGGDPALAGRPGHRRRHGAGRRRGDRSPRRGSRSAWPTTPRSIRAWTSTPPSSCSAAWPSPSWSGPASSRRAGPRSGGSAGPDRAQAPACCPSPRSRWAPDRRPRASVAAGRGAVAPRWSRRSPGWPRSPRRAPTPPAWTA